MNAIEKYQQKKQKLLVELEPYRKSGQKIKLKKKSVSNLFRYEGRQTEKSTKTPARSIDLSQFNHPLLLDETNMTLEVEALTKFEDIVDYVLPRGFLPLITPELKHITIGGVIVGIGIESNCYRYGFVHDSLLEADVLLSNGTIVTCTANNEYSDLFYGLPNSYGTLGYLLKVRIQLRKAKKYVHLQTKKYSSTSKLLESVQKASKDPQVDYIESLVYSKDNMYLTLGMQTNNGKNNTSIYGSNIFYKTISKPGDVVLTTKDYIFRYDPDWFWGLPESKMYNLFRKIAPLKFRNSGFYQRYNKWREKRSKATGYITNGSLKLEKLIQDWEVPWPNAKGLLDFALSHIDLNGKPWLLTSISTPAKAICYPVKKDTLYLNLGSYHYAVVQKGKPKFYNTKIMDEWCFSHDGIKMLYSSTFLNQAEFEKIYNGKAYMNLKNKYDPQGLLPTTYEKTVKAI